MTQRQAVIARISHLPPETQRNIRTNMRRGLLCACNRTRVPYFPTAAGRQGDHGVKVLGRIVHGYDSCNPQ